MYPNRTTAATTQKTMVSVGICIPLHSQRASAALTVLVAIAVLFVVLLGWYEGLGVGAVNVYFFCALLPT